MHSPMTMSPHEPRPVGVFLKGLEIFRSITAGHATIAEISDATGFSASTILRIAALLVADNIVAPHVVGRDLHLTLTYRGPVQPERPRLGHGGCRPGKPRGL